MRQALLFILVAACLLCGCSQPQTPDPTNADAPPTAETVEDLKLRMNDAFAGLEMYAADNSLTYPDSLEVLVPRYLDAVPIDPVSAKPIVFEKTDEGFFLGASGDYSELGAEPGFPKMDQDGFYVKKAEEFPPEP